MRRDAFARRLSLVALLLVAATDALSAQAAGVEAELRRCRGIADSLARIVCYDAIALPAGGTAATSAPTAAPVVPTAAEPAPASAAGRRDLGLPGRPATASAGLVESSIEGEFDGWTAGARLRLANGQVWEIVDGSTASYHLRDPKVRISRGALGSFFMSVDGVSQSPRVRRAQ